MPIRNVLAGGAGAGRRTMAIADIVLGWHGSALFTYAGMLAATAGRPRPARQAERAAAGRCGVPEQPRCSSSSRISASGWAAIMAPASTALIACYVAAIPFWGYSLVGDLGSTAILFGLFLLGRRVTGEPAPQRG